MKQQNYEIVKDVYYLNHKIHSVNSMHIIKQETSITKQVAIQIDSNVKILVK